MADSVTLALLESEPHPLLHRLRTESPVVWVPALDGWMVTGRDLAVRVMRDPEVFTVDDPRFTTAQVIGPSMLSTDGSLHTHHRSPFVKPYSARSIVHDLGHWVDAEAQRLVTKLAPAEEAELRESLAAPLAVSTTIRSLALTNCEPEVVLGWYRDISDSVQRLARGVSDIEAGRSAFRELADTVMSTIADGGSLLADAATELSDEEVASNAAVIMFGAIETSEAATATALLHLLSNPGHLKAVLDDRSLIANAIEESFRLEPAAAFIDRYATRSMELDGAVIGKGDYVNLSLAAANRDPAVFDHPDHFDIYRSDLHKHATFAYGPHSCLGIHLARLETAAAVKAVLDLLPDIHLDPQHTEGPRGLVFRKPVAVWARWTSG